MDKTKITKLLRLMKLLTGNVSRTINQLAADMGITPRTVYRYIDDIRDAGFVVNKLYGNVFQMGTMTKGLTDFKKLIYFTEEEAFIVSKMLNGLNDTHSLKRDLQKKLACVYDCTSIANYQDNPSVASNIEVIAAAIKGKKQVIFHQYESANSDQVRDRLVEPVEFTLNMIDVWAYDVEKGENRIFKISRIAQAEALDKDWEFTSSHSVQRPDVFRMTGNDNVHVKLLLNTRAKNLLLEEYPLAERDLKRIDNKWYLDTEVHQLEGVGRFVIGLAADIQIVEGDALREYVREYRDKHISTI